MMEARHDPRMGMCHPFTAEILTMTDEDTRDRALRAIMRRQNEIRRGERPMSSEAAAEESTEAVGDSREGFRWLGLGEYAKIERTTPTNALQIARNEGREIRKIGRGYQIFTDIPDREKGRRKKSADTVKPQRDMSSKKTVIGSGEVRVVNEQTGGEKGSKDQRFDLIPWEPMQEVAKLYGFGARKYAENNWARGYKWSLSFAAAQRHLCAFWLGESTHEVIEGDPTTECSHLASVIFHCLALMYFEKHHPELDDRQLKLFEEVA